MYALRVDVPRHISSLDVEFQYLSGRTAMQRIQMTDGMLSLEWSNMSLYPAGHYSRDITFAPSVTLPQGWGFGTALETRSRSGDTTDFKPVTYNTLIDSPMYAGRYYGRIDLDPGAAVPVHLDVFADAPNEDIVATLNDIAKYDWAGFLRQHLDAHISTGATVVAVNGHHYSSAAMTEATRRPSAAGSRSGCC